jgi:hypothetical protein
MRGQSKTYEVRGLGQRAIAALALTLLVTLLLACTPQQITETKARIADEAIVAEICDIWMPITDAKSPQVSAHNRARYAFCVATPINGEVR